MGGSLESIDRISIVYDGSWKMEIKFTGTTTVFPLMVIEGDTVRGRLEAQAEGEKYLDQKYKRDWRRIIGG